MSPRTAKIKWSDQSDTARLNKIGKAVVYTEETDAIEDQLKRAIKYAHTGHQGSLHPMTGPTNTGKTTAQRIFMKEYADSNGGIWESVRGLSDHVSGVAGAEYVSIITPEGRMRPVIRIAVGKQPTFNSLLADTIYCLTGRKPPSGEYFAGKMNLVSQQLYNQQIKLLIFDDVQHVSVDKTSRSTHAASEVFKVLAKVLNAEIVLAGLPDGTNAVVAANSQTIPLSINRVDIGPIEYPFVSNDRFHGAMKEISKNMPFDKVSPIGSLEVAQRMHAYSGGVWGTVKQLLRAATMYALENKFDYVDQAILAKAVELGMMPTKAANPFVGPPPAPPTLAQL